MKHSRNNRVNTFGFTIVELLIVVVVIGILAAITIVAYTGVSQQASAAGLKSDLKQAYVLLEQLKVQSLDDTYPVDSPSYSSSPTIDHQYTSSGSSYCLSATNSTQAFRVSSVSGGLVEEGVCEGHDGPEVMSTRNHGVVTTTVGSVGVSGDADGIGSNATFNSMNGLAADSLGNVYLAAGSIIRKISPGGNVTTLAGQRNISGHSNGTGSAATFYITYGVAVDSTGNVFVADTFNHTIRKINTSTYVSTLAGTAGNSGASDGTGASASFYYPFGVAADTSGNVYVADSARHIIRKIDSSGVVTTLAGLAGSSGYTDGTGASARFNGPRGIAVDSSGNVYVVETYNYAIRKISPAGVVTTLAGLSYSYGFANGSSSVARFGSMKGVAVDAHDNVYVTDTNNQVIRRISPAGNVTTLAGAVGESGHTDGTGTAAKFDSPSGIAVDSSGTVYVADYGNKVIRKIE